MKQVFFVRTPPPPSRRGHLVDLSGCAEFGEHPGQIVVDLAPAFQRNGDAWKSSFIEWLGELNRRNAGVAWWAHTTTAKNVLSSPLGNQILQARALCEHLRAQDYEAIYVVGATPAQIRFVQTWLARHGLDNIRVRRNWSMRIPDSWQIVPRLVYQLLRLWWGLFLFAPRLPLPAQPIDLYLFTYLDLKVNADFDAFFGQLPQLLAGHDERCRTLFTGFMHSPARATLARLRSLPGATHWPLFLALTPPDLMWALWKTLCELDGNRYDLGTNHERDAGLDDLLRDALRWDLAWGGYLQNLLVYRAAQRFASKFTPRAIVYPYENKSLEKMLLLGIRAIAPECRLSGYQHTSITPRHTTLLFAANEAKITPLPDRIITCGEVTRQHLEQRGNYPDGIFVTGCALRQKWHTSPAFLPLQGRRIRILLALSSSRFELIRSVRFLRSLADSAADFELGIRPHPEFSLSMLPPGLAVWVDQHAQDLSGTSLADNIDWCDLTAYVSSTVALESLMAGKPVVNFRIGDLLDPDPVLGNPALCWRACDAGEFMEALARIRALSADEHQQLAADAASYVKSYLRPPTAECVRLFAHPPESTAAHSGANATAPAAPTP